MPTRKNVERGAGGGGFLSIRCDDSVETCIFGCQVDQLQIVRIIAFASAVVRARENLIVLEPLHVQVGRIHFAFEFGIFPNYSDTADVQIKNAQKMCLYSMNFVNKKSKIMS